MGRRPNERVRVSVMIDRRLFERIELRSSEANMSRSDVLNELLWAGVLGRYSFQENNDILKKIEEFSDFAKQWYERNL